VQTTTVTKRLPVWYRCQEWRIETSSYANGYKLVDCYISMPEVLQFIEKVSFVCFFCVC